MIIRKAKSQEDWATIARLMRAYVAWHYDRYPSEREIIDMLFDPLTLDKELENLPGDFSRPGGALLIAEDEDAIVGFVGLRPLEPGTCEMKRLFVSSDYRGKGVGALLARAVLKEARGLGHKHMILDTGPGHTEALKLYRDLGFEVVEPYYELPPSLRERLIFMSKELAA